jgi:SAM-dependent methyltransferase
VDEWRAAHGLREIVLDLACGTGQHLAAFESLGYTCYGIDASREMLRIAAGRLKVSMLEQGLFHTFRMRRRVPVITCFFNSLAYNHNLDALRRALGNIHANLCVGGLFVFDLFLPERPGKVFGARVYEGAGLQFSRTFIGVPTPDGFRSEMHLVVFNGRSTELISETTLRGSYCAEDVRAALIERGFSVLYEGEGYSSDRTVFVAQKIRLSEGNEEAVQ